MVGVVSYGRSSLKLTGRWSRAVERASILGEAEQTEVKQTPERLVFVLPQRDDLEQLVGIERMLFHEALLVPPEEQRKQLTFNPEAIHVIKDTNTNTVLGGISCSPLKPDVLEKLIRLEIEEPQIKPEDFLPYTAGTPLDVTKYGERLAKRLHFTLLQSDWTGESADFRHSYVLDLENTKSKSRLVKKYLKQKRDLERRRKPHKKQ